MPIDLYADNQPNCITLTLNRQRTSLKRLAPEISGNAIFLKVIFLLTLHNGQPKNV